MSAACRKRGSGCARSTLRPKLDAGVEQPSPSGLECNTELGGNGRHASEAPIGLAKSRLMVASSHWRSQVGRTWLVADENTLQTTVMPTSSLVRAYEAVTEGVAMATTTQSECSVGGISRAIGSALCD